MSDELSLVDSNVLVYALYADGPHYAVSRALLESAAQPQARLCVTSQVLAEFFSIVTNPRRVSAAQTAEDAAGAVEAILALPGMIVLPMPVDVPGRWLELLRQRPVTGGRVFDLQIVATMQANDVKRIYTFNRGDFEEFPEMTVLTL